MDSGLVLDLESPVPDPLADRLADAVPSLRRYLARLVGPGGAGELDDLVQDVLTRAWRYRGSFLERSPRGPDEAGADGELGPWLRRAARNVFFDHCRARARAPFGTSAASARAVERHGPQPDPLAEQRCERTREPGEALAARDELDHWLARLAPVSREVLVRFHARHESIAEIAAALALPLGTVKSHLHRARAQLAAHTQESGESDPRNPR